MLKTWLLAFSLSTAVLMGGAGWFVLSSPARPAQPGVGQPGAQAPIERLEILETVRSSPRPRVGQPAADLDVRDDIGARFHLGAFRGQPVLLGAFCTCAACRATTRFWNEISWQYPGQCAIAAILAAAPGHQVWDFHDDLNIRFPLLPDPDHALSARYPGPGEGYGALACPRAWVIGPDGRYRYVMPMGQAPTPKVMAEMRRALGLRRPTRTGPAPPIQRLPHESPES